MTLHHFVEPQWFSAKGGFSKAENIQHFVRFCRLVYRVTHRYVPAYATINFDKAAVLLENLISAHTQVYHELKSISPRSQIGITHDILRFRSKNRWFAPERLFARYFTDLTNTAFMKCLKTGNFTIKIPFIANHSVQLERPPLDFLGVQFYSDPLVSFLPPKFGSVTRREGEVISQYQFRLGPEDLGSALQEAHEATDGKPVYITEIGTCVDDAKHPEARTQFMRRIFQVANRAIREGINIPKLFVWTLNDNIEWHKKFQVRFGLFHTDENTGIHTPRPVATWLRERIAALGHALHRAIA